MLRLAVSVLALLVGPVAAAQEPAPRRSLQSAGRFINTTVASWEFTDQPEFVRKPTLAEALRAAPRETAADISLSFNCAVERSGKLADCRPIYGYPETAAEAALARSLAPFFRLSRASATLARDKAYRLTIDLALDTVGRDGMPTSCRPPFCILEGALPPPPPSPPHDPVLAAGLDRADRCFATAWARSTQLWLAAEKALRERADRPATDEDRALVLEYVRSRHALVACMAELRETTRMLPLHTADLKIVKQRRDGMQMNYDGQTRYELAILIGLLDPAAARTEAAIR